MAVLGNDGIPTNMLSHAKKKNLSCGAQRSDMDRSADACVCVMSQHSCAFNIPGFLYLSQYPA